MKKVMLAISLMHGGGAQRVISIWSKELADLGYDVSILLYGKSDNLYSLDERVRCLYIAETYEDYKKLSLFKRLKIMRTIIKRERPDVMINFLPRVQILTMVATLGLKIPKVETVRVSPWAVKDFFNKIYMWLWHRTFKKSKAIIVQTPEQAEYFNKKLQKKCVTIYNPVAQDCIDNPKTEYNEKITNFIASGRVLPQKNYKLMIKAFLNALKVNPNITLSIYGIIGSDSYKLEVEKLIADNGAEDKIKFMGKSMDMFGLFRKSDAFLMTSDYEGMPNALLEAMALGLPCISTDCRTGPKDMIDNGENGYLVSVGNEQAITDAIIGVSNLTKEQAKTMGANARSKILDLCSQEKSIKVLTEVINKVVD